MRSMIRSPYVPRVALGAIAVVVFLGVGCFSWTSRSLAAPAQPIRFPHQLMVQAGVPCLFCHTTATRSPAAGMPSVEKCMGCHRFIGTNVLDIQKLDGYWQRQEPVSWVRVNRLPDFVHFSHQVHVSAGLNCERCHGDVGNMQVMHQVNVQNMGWCLGCHQQQANSQQLMDCVICHY